MSNSTNDNLVEDLAERVGLLKAHLSKSDIKDFETYIKVGDLESAKHLVEYWENSLPIMLDGRRE